MFDGAPNGSTMSYAYCFIQTAEEGSKLVSTLVFVILYVSVRLVLTFHCIWPTGSFTFFPLLLYGMLSCRCCSQEVGRALLLIEVYFTKELYCSVAPQHQDMNLQLGDKLTVYATSDPAECGRMFFRVYGRATKLCQAATVASR